MNLMEHNAKRILAALAAAGVIISFSGCANKEPPSSDANSPSSADVTSSTGESTVDIPANSNPEQSTPTGKSPANDPESNPSSSTDLPDTTGSDGSVPENAPTNSDNGERSYLCSIHESGHENFTFHYVSDKLVKVEYIAYIKGVPEEVEAKNIISEYSGVVMADKTDHYLFEIDMEQDGLKYLKDNFEIFKDLNDTSWEFIEEIMIDSGYSCRENTLD